MSKYKKTGWKSTADPKQHPLKGDYNKDIQDKAAIQVKLLDS